MKKKGINLSNPPKDHLDLTALDVHCEKKVVFFFFFGKKRKDKYCSTVHRQMYAIKRNVSKNTEAV